MKSFTNLIEDKEIDYLQAWYVHNRIPRLITTHTLVSQDVYHKIAPLEKDWYYLSNIKIDGGYFRDKDNDYFVISDGLGRKIIGDNGIYMISNKGRIVASYGSKRLIPLPMVRLRSMIFQIDKPNNHDFLKQYRFYIPPIKYSYYIKKSFSEDNSCFWIGTPDDVHFIFDVDLSFDDFVLPKLKSVSKMSDYSLLQAYLNFDFDENVPQRYAVIHNELVDRCLLEVQKVNPNDYNMSFYDV